MNGARENPHPPVDFPLVGVAAPVAERRWVEFFEGQTGHPVWSVWLGHLTGGGLLVVRTSPRKRWNECMGVGADPAGLAASGAVEFAARGLQALMDVARPELDDDQRAAYNKRVVPTADALAEDWPDWDEELWQLGASPCPARVFRFSRSWSGLSLADSDLYIGVTGYNITNPVVSLEKVDGRSYDFDFTVPFSIADLNDRRGQRPEVDGIVRSAQLQQDDLHHLSEADGTPQDRP